eukprot:191761_1
MNEQPTMKNTMKDTIELAPTNNNNKNNNLLSPTSALKITTSKYNINNVTQGEGEGNNNMDDDDDDDEYDRRALDQLSSKNIYLTSNSNMISTSNITVTQYEHVGSQTPVTPITPRTTSPYENVNTNNNNNNMDDDDDDDE